MNDATGFLSELRQLRNEAGLAPAELAARAHYPHHVIEAAEAGPAIPDLPVLSAYVRGCGGGLAEWEERWRFLTGSAASAASAPGLPARPVGCSSLAAAGARAASQPPAVDPDDRHRILTAMAHAASIPAQATASAHPAQLVPAPPGTPGALTPPARRSDEDADSTADITADIIAATTPGTAPAGAQPGLHPAVRALAPLVRRLAASTRAALAITAAAVVLAVTTLIMLLRRG